MTTQHCCRSAASMQLGHERRAPSRAQGAQPSRRPNPHERSLPLPRAHPPSPAVTLSVLLHSPVLTPPVHASLMACCCPPLPPQGAYWTTARAKRAPARPRPACHRQTVRLKRSRLSPLLRGADGPPHTTAPGPRNGIGGDTGQRCGEVFWRTGLGPVMTALPPSPSPCGCWAP